MRQPPAPPCEPARPRAQCSGPAPAAAAKLALGGLGPRLGLAFCLAFAGVACDRGGGSEAVYPPAEAMSGSQGFSGNWQGAVGSKQGQLRVGELSRGRYFGNFASRDGVFQLALLLDQSTVTSAAGGNAPSNRALFTWQDGDGNRGHGWLKIGDDGDSLEGESGDLESIKGTRWALKRAD